MVSPRSDFVFIVGALILINLNAFYDSYLYYVFSFGLFIAGPKPLRPFIRAEMQKLLQLALKKRITISGVLIIPLFCLEAHVSFARIACCVKYGEHRKNNIQTQRPNKALRTMKPCRKLSFNIRPDTDIQIMHEASK